MTIPEGPVLLSVKKHPYSINYAAKELQIDGEIVQAELYEKPKTAHSTISKALDQVPFSLSKLPISTPSSSTPSIPLPAVVPLA